MLLLRFLGKNAKNFRKSIVVVCMCQIYSDIRGDSYRFPWAGLQGAGWEGVSDVSKTQAAKIPMS